MKLLAGLGNPGKKYVKTRHNAGFFVIDALCIRHKLPLKPGKGDWYEATYELNGEKVLMIKPSTYMNNSGLAVKDCMERNGIEMSDLLVIVDDFQLPLGTVRVRNDGSDGGHNGLASISNELGSSDYPRMRIGIGPERQIRRDEYVDFVLGEFTEKEFDELDKLYDIYADCAESFVMQGVSKTMNSFNKSFLENKANQTDQAGQ
jgi:PTH1 family peptidyl-tRNA hydrolase